MSSPIASVAGINALIFGVYGNVQRRLSDPESLGSHALAGAVAGVVQSFVSSPMELVKTRLQIQEVCDGGKQLYKYAGFNLSPVLSAAQFTQRVLLFCTSLFKGVLWIAPNKSGALKGSGASSAAWASRLRARYRRSAFISRATRP